MPPLPRPLTAALRGDRPRAVALSLALAIVAAVGGPPHARAQAPTWSDAAGNPGAFSNVGALAATPDGAVAFLESSQVPSQPGVTVHLRATAPAGTVLAAALNPDGLVQTGFAVRLLPDGTYVYAYNETAAPATAGRVCVAAPAGVLFCLEPDGAAGLFGASLLPVPGSADLVIGGYTERSGPGGQPERRPFVTRVAPDGTPRWRTDDLPVSGFLAVESVTQVVWSGGELHLADAEVSKVLRVDPADGALLGVVDNPLDGSAFLFGRTALTSRADTTWVATATVFDLLTFYVVDGVGAGYRSVPLGIAEAFVVPYALVRETAGLAAYGGFGKVVSRLRFDDDEVAGDVERSTVEIDGFRVEDRRLADRRALVTPGGALALSGALVDLDGGDLDAALVEVDFESALARELYANDDADPGATARTVRAFAKTDGGVVAVQQRNDGAYVRELDAQGGLVADEPLALPLPSSRVEDAARFAGGNLAVLYRSTANNLLRIGVAFYGPSGQPLAADDYGAVGDYYEPTGRALALTDDDELLAMTTSGPPGAFETEVVRYAADGTQLGGAGYDFSGDGRANAVAALPGGGYALAGALGLPRVDPGFLAAYDPDGDELWRVESVEDQGAFPVFETLFPDAAGGLVATTSLAGEAFAVRADGSGFARLPPASLPSSALPLGIVADRRLAFATPGAAGGPGGLPAVAPRILTLDLATGDTTGTTLAGLAGATALGIDGAGGPAPTLYGTVAAGAGTRAWVARAELPFASPTRRAPAAPRDLYVWPNPAGRGATVALGARFAGRPFALYDLRGRRVLAGVTSAAGRVDLARAAVPAGTYVLALLRGARASHRARIVIADD